MCCYPLKAKQNNHILLFDKLSINFIFPEVDYATPWPFSLHFVSMSLSCSFKLHPSCTYAHEQLGARSWILQKFMLRLQESLGCCLIVFFQTDKNPNNPLSATQQLALTRKSRGSRFTKLFQPESLWLLPKGRTIFMKYFFAFVCEQWFQMDSCGARGTYTCQCL